ncbi:hypothetical protein AB1Y20_011552 [Prymnesium parvum]|uniref:Glutathione transferase n=1 Tax=Prymnesium parvum TaxID=97485 RepID=A0AB34IHH3_PRYPA|mmetsp:Transcript_26578/g.40002  ORF Transcript_26578/g.40002 Transcript_26578/m.40002 type:complete len:269 (+) Transcript_26578:42-848(+)
MVVAHTPGSWRLIYFDAPNRGEQVRILFYLASTPFVDVRVDPYPQGLDPYKKAAMGNASPLLGTDLCPAVTAPDGTHCVETAEIMRFVGQRVGMAPPAESEADARAMKLTLLAQALLNQVFYALLKPMVVRAIFERGLGERLGCVASLLNGRQATFLEKPRSKLARALPELEGALEASGGPYLCGAALTYADAAVFHVLNEVLAFKCFDKEELLKPYPLLCAFVSELERKTAGWIEKRVREHQMGIPSTIDFFAATNTPFPWSRVAKK